MYHVFKSMLLRSHDFLNAVVFAMPLGPFELLGCRHYLDLSTLFAETKNATRC